MNCRLRMGCLPAEDPHTSRTGSRRPEPVLNNPEAQHRQLTVCPRPTGPLRLSRRDGPLADLNAEHHRRAYALASADAIMPGSKSGLDQRFFLKFKFEDAGVDLTRAAVSFGGGQRIGQDRQPLDLLIQASARKATGSLGQPMSRFSSRTCNDGVASFDTASVIDRRCAAAPLAPASVRTAPQPARLAPVCGLKHGLTSSHLRFCQQDGFEHDAGWQRSEEPADPPHRLASRSPPLR